MNPPSFIELNLCEVIGMQRKTITIEKALAPLEEEENTGKTILIQASPGMGKSMLIKEIAFRWAKQQRCLSQGEERLLQKFELVLRISFRDIQEKIVSVKELLKQHFCEEDDEKHLNDIVESLHSGEKVAVLLDGYDEFQSKSRVGVIAKILKREVLSQSTLIISSRPHAVGELEKLCGSQCTKIEILGFTEDSQRAFIRQTLLEQPASDDVKQSEDVGLYNKFCEVPFNLVVLLALRRNSIPLPKNLSDLHMTIICFSVRRHLEKLGKPPGDFDFSKLPSPFDNYIRQLAEFCYRSILSNSRKLHYSFTEINESFQELSETEIRAFGLFKRVEVFGNIGSSLAYEFVHVSIKEFLAAHYINAHLPEDQKLPMLTQYFFTEHLSNMFILYIELSDGHHLREFISTAGQSCLRWLGCSKFLRYLCCFAYHNNAASLNITKCTELVRIHIFQCFKQAAENMPSGSCMRREFTNLCDCIEETFQRKIYFVALTLSASDLDSIAFLLSHSFNDDWLELCLMDCSIQDHGIIVLHEALKDHNPTITELNLQSNNLTSKVDHKIHKIVTKCKVKTLWLGYNTVGSTREFSTVLSDPDCKLDILEMHTNNLTSEAIEQIFDELQLYRPDNHKLILDVMYNDISNQTCTVIAAMLKDNKSLEQLELSPATVQGAKILLDTFRKNTTLKSLTLPTYSEECKKDITVLQEEINEYRRANEVEELEIKYDPYYHKL